MEEQKTDKKTDKSGKFEDKAERNRFSKLFPLVNLWPAALVAALVFGTLPATGPVLQDIPELLSINAEAAKNKDIKEEKGTKEQAKGDFEDGVYQGTGTGYGGTIKVEVTVEDGSITSVTILSAPGETDSFFKRAQGVIDSVIQKQTWEVDAVSGATYSSKGILAAIQNALTGEKVETETAPVQETEALVKENFEEPEGYKDGTYYGSARGFGGNIQVQVVIAEGKITDISIVSASSETPSYLASAKAVINRILSAQSPNVDTISGATYSSNGIINAVKSALRQAAGPGTSEDLAENETPASGFNGTSSSSHKKPVITKPPVVSRDGYVDGVYEGTAEGFGGDITVQVAISDGKIASIKIVSAEDETPSYLAQAEAVIGRMIKAQSPAVDVVSGATYSSTGIINATSAALNKALPAGSEEKLEVPETTGSAETEKPETSESKDDNNQNNENEENTAKYKDGVYQGEAICQDEDTFTYTVRAKVTVKDGAITEIDVEKIDDRSDDPDSNDSYLDYAINGRTRSGVWYEGVVSQIITDQSTDHVDVVSCATYSSNAITEAVKNAFSQAIVEENPTDDSSAESSSQESSEEEPTESVSPSETESSSSNGNEGQVCYLDGIYQAEALCEDEDDTFTYTIRTNITVKDGVITEVAVEKLNDNSEDPESNDSYLNYAINGRTRRNIWYEGLVNQILTKQSADELDIVSGATYSSHSITEAAGTALSMAAAEANVSEEAGKVEEEKTEMAAKAGSSISVLDYVIMAWDDLTGSETERSLRS